MIVWNPWPFKFFLQPTPTDRIFKGGWDLHTGEPIWFRERKVLGDRELTLEVTPIPGSIKVHVV